MGEICKTCGIDHSAAGKRKDLGIKVTKEELDSLKLLNTKVSCADQALKQTQFSSELTQKEKSDFINSVLDRKSDYMFMQNGWWDEIKAKYNSDSTQDLYIDFVDGSLYVVE